MSSEFAGRLARLVRAVLACRAATTETRRLSCAGATNDAAAGLIRAASPDFRDVDAWPTLYVDGNGGKDAYRYDYSILIDRGGNDFYDNNAGGNLQDIKFGPRGSAAPEVGPRDRVRAGAGELPGALASGHDCIAAPQVVFIDLKSAERSSTTSTALSSRRGLSITIRR